METEAKAFDPKTDSVALFVIGMAGSGKTTLVTNWTIPNQKVHRINLGPAVLSLSYEPIYDIRSEFPYKKVMEEFKLGPNGAIMTALNMFSAKADSLLTLIQ